MLAHFTLITKSCTRGHHRFPLYPLFGECLSGNDTDYQGFDLNSNYDDDITGTVDTHHQTMPDICHRCGPSLFQDQSSLSTANLWIPSHPSIWDTQPLLMHNTNGMELAMTSIRLICKLNLEFSSAVATGMWNCGKSSTHLVRMYTKIWYVLKAALKSYLKPWFILFVGVTSDLSALNFYQISHLRGNAEVETGQTNAHYG